MDERWRAGEDAVKSRTGEVARARRDLNEMAGEARRNINRSIGKASDRRKPDYRNTSQDGATAVSAKEEMIVQIESAKEKLAEAITEMQGVVSTIGDTQVTVQAVMGDADEHFAAAAAVIEAAITATLAVADRLDEAIGSVNEAGQQ